MVKTRRILYFETAGEKFLKVIFIGSSCLGPNSDIYPFTAGNTIEIIPIEGLQNQARLGIDDDGSCHEVAVSIAGIKVSFLQLEID